jgi:hypothetical protein
VISSGGEHACAPRHAALIAHKIVMPRSSVMHQGFARSENHKLIFN